MKTNVCSTLETERLLLRPPEQGDTRAIACHCGDPLVALKTSAIPHPYLPGDASAWIKRVARERHAGETFAFGIERNSTRGVIGAISLMVREDRCSAVIGYWLGVPFWRRGYMTEALREILRHGFEDVGLLYVAACHMAGNPASGRVMQKARMIFQNVTEGGICRDGVLHDKVNYGVFADEWRTHRF